VFPLNYSLITQPSDTIQFVALVTQNAMRMHVI